MSLNLYWDENTFRQKFKRQPKRASHIKKYFLPKPCFLFIFIYFFDVLLTVHLSLFISVFNQLDAQNLFYNKF